MKNNILSWYSECNYKYFDEAGYKNEMGYPCVILVIYWIYWKRAIIMRIMRRELLFHSERELIKNSSNVFSERCYLYDQHDGSCHRISDTIRVAHSSIEFHV